MDFSLNEEQKQIKALIRDFSKREVDQARMTEILRKNDATKNIEAIRANYPHDLVEKAHNAGLRTIGIPTKYGGPGPDKNQSVTMAVALEEAGYSAGLAAQLLLGPEDGFAIQAMRRNPYATEEEREVTFARWLQYSREMGHGTVSEPAGSVDIHLPYDEGGDQILQVTAHKDGDEWVINGDKMFCSNGAVIDAVTVFARTKEGPISESASTFRLRADTPGVSRTLNRLIFTDFGGNCQYNYDNVRVPESALVGRLHGAYRNLAYTFQYKWQVRSHGVGLLLRLYEHMHEFAKQRVAGGRPIIQHTNIAAKLGDLAMHLESLRSLHYRVAWETDQMEEAGVPPPPLGNWYWYQTFLIYLKQVSFRFFEAAHDIYGSVASSDDLPLEGILRYNLHMRAAPLPPDMGLIRACWDYDTRFYYQTY